jgi:hypothetical protein
MSTSSSATPRPKASRQDTLGDALKIIQIAFYTIGMIVAILTYRAAKRGLLNTVNTEYQKRVMDRLQKLSEDLYSEFDLSAPTHWARIRPVHEAIEAINKVFENRRDEILTARKYYCGTPYTEDVRRLRDLLDPVVSDPFIPENIRAAVIDLLNVWCEIGSCYQSTKSAKARCGRPRCSLSQMQKLCRAIFAAKRA